MRVLGEVPLTADFRLKTTCFDHSKAILAQSRLIHDLSIVILALSIAILALSNAILDLSIVILALSIVILALSIAILDLSIAILDLSNAILDLSIAILALSIAILALSNAILGTFQKVLRAVGHAYSIDQRIFLTWGAQAITATAKISVRTALTRSVGLIPHCCDKAPMARLPNGAKPKNVSV